MLIQKAKIRPRPKTGLGNRKQAKQGVIYCHGKHLGEEVAVIPFRAYMSLLWEIKSKNRGLEEITDNRKNDLLKVVRMLKS